MRTARLLGRQVRPRFDQVIPATVASSTAMEMGSDVSSLLLALALAWAADIPESQLKTEENGRFVFPLAFRGTWASSLAECKSDFTFEILADRLHAYESRSIIIINSGLILHSDSKNEPAYTTVSLVGQSGEGEVGISKLRVSRVGEKLYSSDADVVSEDEHWKHANVRCPSNAR
jgi:hypothetical protein